MSEELYAAASRPACYVRRPGKDRSHAHSNAALHAAQARRDWLLQAGGKNRDPILVALSTANHQPRPCEIEILQRKRSNSMSRRPAPYASSAIKRAVPSSFANSRSHSSRLNTTGMRFRGYARLNSIGASP
jgi:hypothetical protein